MFWMPTRFKLTGEESNSSSTRLFSTSPQILLLCAFSSWMHLYVICKSSERTGVRYSPPFYPSYISVSCVLYVTCGPDPARLPRSAPHLDQPRSAPLATSCSLTQTFTPSICCHPVCARTRGRERQNHETKTQTPWKLNMSFFFIICMSAWVRKDCLLKLKVQNA